MTRPGRGFTLAELLVVVSTMGVVGSTMLTVATTVRGEERLSAACADDLTGLRRALREVERELRAAPRAGAVTVHRVGDELRRGSTVLARNVARFDVTWEGDVARVRLALGPRSDAPHRREADLDLVVRRRAGKEGP